MIWEDTTDSVSFWGKVQNFTDAYKLYIFKNI